jgi:hypothetical protein
MNRLPRELLVMSGMTAALLGDICQIPAHRIRRAVSGEACLTPDEYQTCVNVMGVYRSNRERAETIAARGVAN